MIVGIDLGTTNSLVGVWRDGKAELIPNALGSVLTPSVVGINDDGLILVGQAARDRLVSHPLQTAAVFKRHMGTDKKISVGTHSYRAEELSAFVLGALKADAEAFLGETVTEAVITIPAYFNDAQRKATKVAGQLAGLHVERLLTEPTAAALAYGFTPGGEENTILVIDLGGGTLDVSLLHSFEGIMEVKATAGDIWLGGEDFTEAIAAAFMAEAGTAAGISQASGGASVLAAIKRQAELAKRMLSDKDSATLSVNFEGRPVEWTLSRERFEQLSEPLLARVRAPLERALRDSRLSAESISRIIFAGGAARMPMFRRMISRLFRQLPLTQINPDEVVARGAVVRAGLSAGDASLEEHVLTDVAPFTMGVEVASRVEGGGLLDGRFLPIIERNSIIPTSRSHTVQTLENNQTAIQLKIYQGESRATRDNILIGELPIRVPKGPAGQEKLEVRFTYDPSGLLEVDVIVQSTQARENLVIEGNPGVLSKAEIKTRLAALAKIKIHPRDEAVNAGLIARAERLFEENLGDMRAVIGHHLDAFMMAIESQNADDIEEARGLLTRFLDSIDSTIRF